MIAKEVSKGGYEIAVRLEISTKPGVMNALGENFRKRIAEELGLFPESIKVVDVYTIDADLSSEELEMLREKVFTDPVSETSSIGNLPAHGDFDLVIEVGWKPGLTDNASRIAAEAMHDLGFEFERGEGIYSSTQYRIKRGEHPDFDPEMLASRLLANPLVQRWHIKDHSRWCAEGMPLVIPKAVVVSKPRVEMIDLGCGMDELMERSAEGEWGLNRAELRAIKEYYERTDVTAQRERYGLTDMPTDAEMESLAQTWSEHCKHKQFNALIRYTDPNGNESEIDGLFNTYIKGSTEEIMKTRPWIKSVFWDNAGVMEFNRGWLFCLKCETHNSPSNMEGYGGAITGIVGVYRDPMGTGMGAKIVFGYYGFVVGPQDYDGELRPPQHPRVLLERVRKGVEDGGNKHGVPTPYGRVLFHRSYLGKCVILVAAGGIIPSKVGGRPGWEKRVEPGDHIVMAGGRIGIDGIHGATASSRPFDGTTPAGHVQIGDPYMQKKLMDMLLEARDLGSYNFVQDNGAGGLNSSVGEMAQHCGKKGGCILYLDKAPLKYANLDPWEILVSESQERMSFAVPPGKIEKFMNLAKKHDVEATVLGEFLDSGVFQVKYGGDNVVCLDMDFLHDGVPQMELEARLSPPENHSEPVLSDETDITGTLVSMLSRPNICGREYIARQFDHEVQGGSVIKPLVGVNSDVESDAVVLRPILDSMEGLAVSSGLGPQYGRLDAYHMSALSIDEAIRRIIAVGGTLARIVLNDNFNWPNSLDDPHKLAQLVRANQALYDYTIVFGTPCISGKDSMSVDGVITDGAGNVEMISGLPLVHYLAVGKIEDVRKCVTMDAKMPGDLVYVVGLTKDELGGSEYYEILGADGGEVPKVDAENAVRAYNSLHGAVQEGMIASIHGCYRGGLGVALAQTAFAGELGMEIDLARLPREGIFRDDEAVFSESPGRFVITIDPAHEDRFEHLLGKTVHSCIGRVMGSRTFTITGINGDVVIRTDISSLKEAWRSPMRWRA